MKILLVYPNIRGMNMLPPAVALFSSILKQHGHKISLFDSTDYPNPEGDDFNSDKLKEKNLNVRSFDDTLLRVSFKEEDVQGAFIKHTQEFNPGLIAMSCTEDMFPIGIILLKAVARFKIPVLVGGVFPTFAPELVMSYPEIDMVCVGEGEHVIAELCGRIEKAESFDNIPGLWIRKNGSIKRNPMGPVVDINGNPNLDLSIFNEGRLYRPMQGRVWRMFPLETHRGCPYRCTFCNSPFQLDKYRAETGTMFFRKKRIDKIRDEIIFFRDKYKVEAFYLWSDTFFAYSDREFDEFVEMYSEFKIPFWCQTRPETVTYERVRKLVDIGLFRMAFGIEHGNQEFRKQVLCRNVTNEKILNALNIVTNIGLTFSVNNILGFPYETRELTFDTIELNRHVQADGMNAYSFSPFHGTPLRAIAEKEGFIKPEVIARSVTKPTLLKMPQYPPEEIEGMRRCFMFYVKMPKDRWEEIKKAESLTPDGDAAWEKLRQECVETYIKL